MDVPFALTQARALDAVVRHGSFSRAAAELGLTQPAVSMQVRQLEAALGLPLVERMGKRAFATRAGELLLEHSARAVRELETAVQMLQRLRGRVAGRIRIGTSASLSIYVLPPVFRSFRARHPDVELIVVTGNAPEIAHAIVANQLDIGITSLPVRERELTVLPFCEDEQVAIAPRRAPWRPRRRITAAATSPARRPSTRCSPRCTRYGSLGGAARPPRANARRWVSEMSRRGRSLPSGRGAWRRDRRPEKGSRERRRQAGRDHSAR